MMLQVSLLTFASQKSSVFVTWLAVEAESNLSMSSVLFCIFLVEEEKWVCKSLFCLLCSEVYGNFHHSFSLVYFCLFIFISPTPFYFLFYISSAHQQQRCSVFSLWVPLLKLTQKSCVRICIKKGEIYRFICWCCWFFSFFLSCGGKTEKGPKISFILQKYFFYGALPH